MHGAAEGRVEQRGRETAVHASDRVQVPLAGLAAEQRVALVDLDEVEADQLRDRRRRDLAFDHRAQVLEPGHLARLLDDSQVEHHPASVATAAGAAARVRPRRTFASAAARPAALTDGYPSSN